MFREGTARRRPAPLTVAALALRIAAHRESSNWRRCAARNRSVCRRYWRPSLPESSPKTSAGGGAASLGLSWPTSPRLGASLTGTTCFGSFVSRLPPTQHRRRPAPLVCSHRPSACLCVPFIAGGATLYWLDVDAQQRTTKTRVRSVGQAECGAGNPTGTDRSVAESRLYLSSVGRRSVYSGLLGSRVRTDALKEHRLHVLHRAI